MKLYKIFNLISLFLIIVMGIYIGVEYPSLPEEIPTHFNLSGEPDSWGSKATIWILVAVSIFLYFLLSFLPKMDILATNNVMKNVELRQLMVNVLLFLVSLLFFYIVYETIQVGKGLKQNLGNGTFVFVALILLVSLGFNWYAAKKQKEENNLNNALEEKK